MTGRWWPESRHSRVLVVFLLIGSFALLHWIPWHLAAIPIASVFCSWLGRRLLQLDDD